MGTPTNEKAQSALITFPPLRAIRSRVRRDATASKRRRLQGENALNGKNGTSAMPYELVNETAIVPVCEVIEILYANGLCDFLPFHQLPSILHSRNPGNKSFTSKLSTLSG